MDTKRHQLKVTLRVINLNGY